MTAERRNETMLGMRGSAPFSRPFLVALALLALGGAGAALSASACSGDVGPSDATGEGAVCGDGVCSENAESCDRCREDCGACPSCGDGVCELATDLENCSSCPEDCGVCGACGDGSCDLDAGEDCGTCADDCGKCEDCGDGTCAVEEGETCASCDDDCGVCEACGDDTCDEAGGESCGSCPDDCGPCEACGDGECDEDAGENCGSCAKDCGSCQLRPGCKQGDFEAFHGNLHAHTHYSDGMGTPAKAFSHARKAGLDFMWVSDHREGLTPSEWSACKSQANAANEPGKFVAGCGFEMSIWSGTSANPTRYGHINTLFTGSLMTIPKDLSTLYSRLEACHPCVGQWNHPPSPGDFGDFKYYAKGRNAMRLIEMNGGSAWEKKLASYFLALSKGWRVAPAWNEDNHKESWGDSNHATGVWATELSRKAIRSAVRSRRTFAAGDDTATIKLSADGACWMGSVLQGFGKTAITVELADREPEDGFGGVTLFGPKQAELGKFDCAGKNPCKASFSLDVTKPTHVVAFARQKDGQRMVSSPIWFVEP